MDESQEISQAEQMFRLSEATDPITSWRRERHESDQGADREVGKVAGGADDIISQQQHCSRSAALRPYSRDTIQ